MKNGKPSLIFDIRYFCGGPRYLRDEVVTAYGRRLAWYLNSMGISLGAYHSLYVNFTTRVRPEEVRVDDYRGGGELWWLRKVHYGVPSKFPDIADLPEIATRGTVAALQAVLPAAESAVDRADEVVRTAREMRFLIRELEFKRYKVQLACTIGEHPEPSHLYATVSEPSIGAVGKTSGLPFGFYAIAFDEARSISLRDFDIGAPVNGHLPVDWCERILKFGAPTKPETSGPVICSGLVHRM